MKQHQPYLNHDEHTRVLQIMRLLVYSIPALAYRTSTVVCTTVSRKFKCNYWYHFDCANQGQELVLLQIWLEMFNKIINTFLDILSEL
ncbi:hypothetical protein BpHYR1_006940 [Brachionus plicatilis]|uniref:Uncharacterized protein n=1 Tax=Brachionus plicatilis TaxID=10195 RepID=A0A3M7SFX3_BRAPC|nr:hypothetical protein BpHYR1_006940 [Brachionus plicatilis]